MASALLDLSFLTEEERQLIEKVVKQDEDLRIKDRIRLGTLRQKYEAGRHHQENVPTTQCSCCDASFTDGGRRKKGVSVPCPSCGHMTCSKCRHKPHSRQHKFICTVCEDKWMLDIQTKKYNDVEPPSLLHQMTINSSPSKSGQDPVARAVPHESPQLHGSDLIKRSLTLRPTKTRAKSSASPEKVDRSSPSSSPVNWKNSEANPINSSSTGSHRAHAMRLSSSEVNTDSDTEKPSPQRESGVATSSDPPVTTCSPSISPGKQGQSEFSSVQSGQFSVGQDKKLEDSRRINQGPQDITAENETCTGKVLVEVRHKNDSLLVNVVEASGLPSRKDGRLPYAYVVALLMPSEQNKKSAIQSPTRNPVFNEAFTYDVPQGEMKTTSLLITIMDHVRKEKTEDSILGQTKIFLGDVNLMESKQWWYDLIKNAEQIPHNNMCMDTSLTPGEEAASSELSNGKVLVKLQFEPHSNSNEVGDLIVEIQKAELSQKTSCFVALRLLPKNRAAEKKTRIKNDTIPVWDESFKFEQVSIADLKSNLVLDIALINWNSNISIGRFKLGAGDNAGTGSISKEGVNHWDEMLSKPGSAVHQWHSLTPSSQSAAMKQLAESTEYKPLSESSVIEPSRELQETPPVTPQSVVSANPFGDGSEDMKSPVSGSPEGVVTRRHRSAEEHIKPDRMSTISSLLSSRESLFSNISITGEVMFGVWHKLGRLYIHVARAANLGLSSESSCNPYVKTYLLPDKDKRTKKKTAVKKNTQEPEYDDTIVYIVQEADVQSRTLCLSVWDKGKLKRNHFMGEVRLPLTTVDLNDSTDRWYALGDKVSDGASMSGKVKGLSGNIHLGIMFELSPDMEQQSQDEGVLHVRIEKASDLSAKSSSKLKKVSVVCTLLPSKDYNDRREILKLGKGTCPVWEEIFHFKNLTLRQLLEERVLEIAVYERKELLGGVRLGGYPGRSKIHQPWMDATDMEALSWERMLRDHGKWINECYPLRPSLAPKLVDLSQPLPEFNVLTPSLPKQSSFEPRLSSPENGVNSVQEPEDEAAKISTPSEPEDLNLSPEGGGLEVLHETPVATSDLPAVSVVNSKELMSPINDNSTVASEEPDPVVEATASTGDDEHKVSQGEKLELTELIQNNETSRAVNKAEASQNVGATTTQSEHGEMKNSEDDESLLKDTSPDASKDTPPDTLKDMPLDALKDMPLDISKGSPPDTSIDTPPGASKDTPSDNSKDTPYDAPKTPPISLKDTAPLVRTASNASEMAEEESSPLKDMHPFGVPRSTGTSVSSFGSMASVYSAAGGKGNYDITGEVLFGVFYRDGHLVIHVNRARGIAAADKNGLSDPYVKTYLLPDKRKQTKKKTGIKRKTVNPVYDETIKYSLSEKKLSLCTLWLSVWDWDRFGRNQFLGEVRLPLNSLDMSDTTDHWYPLAESNDDQSAVYRGEITLSLKVESTTSKKGKPYWTLHVHLVKGTDLYHSESKAMADSFIKCFLLPDKSSSGKRKTGVIKNNKNPVWDEKYSFEKLSLDELKNKRVLQVTVWDYSKNSSSEFIGGLRLGPGPADVSSREEWMDSIGEEVKHWSEVIAKPGEWVQHSHTLRSTMDYRSLKMD